MSPQARLPVNICTLDYVEAAMEADRRMRAGEHQHYCAACRKWFWPLHPDEHEHQPQPTDAEFRYRKRRKQCWACVEIEAMKQRRQWRIGRPS